MEDSYIKYLQSLSGRTACIVPVPGNSGDVLLRMGNSSILSKCGLSLTYDLSKADYLITPGGNPAMWFAAHRKMWQYYMSKNPAAKLIIAPSTFRSANSDFAQFLTENRRRISGVFARDYSSLESLRSVVGQCRLNYGFGDDPAIHLREHAVIKELRHAGSEDYVLVAMRTDACEALGETAGLIGALEGFSPYPVNSLLRRHRFSRERKALQQKAISASQFDLPIRYDDVSMHHNPFMFAELIRGAAEVHTNRLHAMIMSCLLGKKTYAYSTGYGKLEAVYQASVESWAKVHFVK